jgi:hypothetical protein
VKTSDELPLVIRGDSSGLWSSDCSVNLKSNGVLGFDDVLHESLLLDNWSLSIDFALNKD